MKETNIVILGGGYAGIEAAKRLHKNFKKQSDVNITLIDQNNFHALITELHEVAGYRVNEDSIKIPFEHIFQHTNVNFVNDRFIKVDKEHNKVILKNSELEYDYLIVATGSETASIGIPGIEDHAFYLWSLDEALAIKEQITKMFEMAKQEVSAAKRKEMLTFVVGGGGFTGVEMMGELIQWTRFLAKEYDINSDEIRLVIVEALSNICSTLDEKLRKKANNFLTKKGVEIISDAPITELTPDEVFLRNKNSIKTKTLIWTSGVQANSFVKQTGLSLSTKNRIQVNNNLQTVDNPNIYAIGDNALSTNQEGECVPPFVEAALQTAGVAAYNISNSIKGKKERKQFVPNFHGVMVSIGSTYGVADIMGRKISGFLAIIMKHLVNLHYIFGVGGLESCIEYFQGHFMAKTRRKPLFWETLIGHFNARSRSFWLAIARIALGSIWLLSAFDKVKDGWLLAGDKLVSGATMQLIGDNSPQLYIWFVENVIYPNALLFQVTITLTELFIALTFLTGAFTFIGAAIAVFMNINFFFSGTGEIYFLIAHIPMLGGAGRAFGLDYYIMPYIMSKMRFWQRN